MRMPKEKLSVISEISVCDTAIGKCAPPTGKARNESNSPANSQR